MSVSDVLSSFSDNLNKLLAQKENSKLVMAKLEAESLSSVWVILNTVLAQKEIAKQVIAKLEEDSSNLIEEIKKRVDKNPNTR